MFRMMFSSALMLTSSVRFAGEPKRKAVVGIEGQKFAITGQPTYKGRVWNGKSIEGLLHNSRMVQATFDDLNPKTVEMWTYPDT